MRKQLEDLMVSLKKTLPNNLNIGTKVTLFYLLLLAGSLAASSFLYLRISSKMMSAKVSAISLQTLTSISANINMFIENANDYSRMILANEYVQDGLRNGAGVDLETRRNINKHLIRLLDNSPPISAIYLFDNFGHRYGADKLTVKTFRLNNITEAAWYNRAIRAKGGYILKLNAGNIFRKNTAADESYVSMIRVVNDLNSQKPIGILIVNLSGASLMKSICRMDHSYFKGIVLKDENNEDIAKVNDLAGVDFNRFLRIPSQEYSYSTQKIKNNCYLISELPIPNIGWRIISIMPFDELSRETRLFAMIALAIILLNSALLFAGSVFISKLITAPINQLLHSMKDVENGKLARVDLESGFEEIRRLKDGYNLMILKIRQLFERTVAEQKLIRQAELDILQAQIKPHFLYNTFDAISSLALKGRTQEVYTTIKALGSYYRTSLSKGKQIITIGEEIAIVKNYLTIQQIRYGDILAVEYRIDEQVLPYNVLKLILQPLVENSIYHGIKLKGEKGLITIEAKYGAEGIELTVADDGVGMDPEILREFTTGKPALPNAGFGLRGTIERLRIFYGVEDVVAIRSKKGEGTAVTVKIPLPGGKTHG